MINGKFRYKSSQHAIHPVIHHVCDSIISFFKLFKQLRGPQSDLLVLPALLEFHQSGQPLLEFNCKIHKEYFVAFIKDVLIFPPFRR